MNTPTFDREPEALRDFAEEHSGFAGWVKELRVRITEQLLRQHVEHLVSDVRRREDLIVRQVGKAGQHIRLINACE